MMATRTGAAAQAVKTRARAWQKVAVDADDGDTGGSGLQLARAAVAQGSAPAMAVTTDADDGGSGGSRLWQQGFSEYWGGEKMKYVKSQPPHPPLLL